MLYCETCKKPQHANFEALEDEHGYRFIVPHCQECGTEMHREAGTCVVCGENIKPDESLCDSCREEIGAFVELMASAKGVEKDKVLDGLAEYLD